MVLCLEERMVMPCEWHWYRPVFVGKDGHALRMALVRSSVWKKGWSCLEDGIGMIQCLEERMVMP